MPNSFARSRSICLFGLLAFSGTLFAQSDRLFCLKKGEGFSLDRQTGEASINVSIDPQIRALPSQPIAQTFHPVDGLHYFVLSDIPESQLIAFDSGTGLTSGVCSIDPIADATASIEFGAAADGYPLYTVGGGSNAVPGAIYIVDTVTGDAIATGWATAGGGGHSIVFNPNDDCLYHFYNTSDSGSGDPRLEKINTDTGVVTPVALSGTVHGVCNGSAYLDGVFYVVQKSSQQLYSVTPAGVASLVGTMPAAVRSIASDGSALFALGPDTSLQEIDTTTAAYSNPVAVTNGAPVTQQTIEALVRDPTTGILYMVAARNFPGDPTRDAIYQLDPLSGKVINQVDLAVDKLTGFAFLPNGVLHAVSALGPTTDPGPDELVRGTTATINLSDGTVTPLPWETTISSDSRSEIALAYNDDDGRLYRVRKDLVAEPNGLILEAIDPSTGIVAPVGTIPVDSTGSSIARDMVYDSVADLFYLAVQSNGVYAVTPSGASTLLLGEPPIRTLALEIEPDLRITGGSADGSSASISFESVAGREYGLYSSSDLINYDPVPGFETIQADAPENTETDLPLPAIERGFYRLGPPAAD